MWLCCCCLVIDVRVKLVNLKNRILFFSERMIKGTINEQLHLATALSVTAANHDVMSGLQLSIDLCTEISCTLLKDTSEGWVLTERKDIFRNRCYLIAVDKLLCTVIVALGIWFLFSYSTNKYTLSHTVNRAENIICLCKFISVSV